MTPFDQKFIENPQFLNWVFKSNPVVEIYWEHYLIENPQEADQLLELKARLTELRFSNDIMTISEKEELGIRITSRLNREVKHNKRRLILNTLMKYAAVALIFAAIGGLVVYFNIDRGNIYQQFAQQTNQVYIFTA